MTDTAPAPAQQLIDHTFTEKGGPLPELFYLTTITRERVQRMNPDAQAQALGAWQAAGFPAARDANGESVHLGAAQLRAISTLLASFERTIDDLTVVRAVTDRLDELSSGERWTVREVARGHGIDNVTALLFTDGELYTLGRIIDRVVELREQQPAPAAELEPLPDPGRTVTQPVDDPAELELSPPDGKVGEVLEWVGDDPRRAAKALDSERCRPKPRKTLLGKLELLVEHDDAPAPAGEDPLSEADADRAADTAHAGDETRAQQHSGDPFDGVNGEPPTTSSTSSSDETPPAGVTAEGAAALESIGKQPPAVTKVPNVPPPSVTRAGGRLTPADALEHIAAVVGDLRDAVVALEQLADRIRREDSNA